MARRPCTQGGNFPSIFDNTGVFMLPLQNRPASGLHSLQLDIKALPNTGLYHLSTTTPRERPEIGMRLSSSDSRPDRTRQASRRPNLARHSITNGEVLHHHSYQPPTPITSIKDPLIHHHSRSGVGRRKTSLMPLCVGPPSAVTQESLVHNTLPPIGGKAMSYTEDDEVTEGSVVSEERRESTLVESSTSGNSDSDSDDEDFLETESEVPPSRPGFESDAEKSAEILQIPFPNVNVSLPFPTTMIQEQAQLDTERYAQTTSSSGLSPRVNNIVRGYMIHGPLDKNLLVQALNEIVQLHPLLFASFKRSKGCLYAQVPNLELSGKTVINLETPLVGHEHSEDLVLNARRKIFLIDVHSGNMQVPSNERDTAGLLDTLSLTSMGDSDTSTKNSPTTELAPRKKTVSFAEVSGEKTSNESSINPPPKHAQLPALDLLPPKLDKPNSPLIRVRLVSKTRTKHVFVLSFPRIICDFWSSCLFMQQLTDLYSRLEKSVNYKPSLAARKLEIKKQEVVSSYERERKKNNQGRRIEATARLMQKKYSQSTKGTDKEEYVPMFPAKLKFQQVAQRERQLLMMLPRERLLAFWESVVTATIKRQRGLNRIKVVPPVRIPSGMGEIVGQHGRPQTSRLRPLTASRNRPTTARRQGGRGGGAFGDVGVSREALLGPKTRFHFIKIEEEVCEKFKLHLPEYCQSTIQPDDLFRLFTLGTYVLLLGKCCRGWGMERHMTTEHQLRVTTDTEDSSTHRIEEASSADFIPPMKQTQIFADPLQKYKSHGRPRRPQPVTVASDQFVKPREGRKGTRLDVGSFLIGVEISLRNCEPSITEGLFGPLTNDAAIRINLSSSETFIDLLMALSRSLRQGNNHGHYPFAPVEEEVGLINGLPIKFSYLGHRDVIQLANPNNYFYMETAMGVVNQGLGRLGSHCYLTPLNTKLDDTCHLELILWESYDYNHSLAGGIHYQPHILKTELVERFGEEFCRLLRIIAECSSCSLLELAKEIRPPFLSSRLKMKGRKGLNQR